MKLTSKQQSKLIGLGVSLVIDCMALIVWVRMVMQRVRAIQAMVRHARQEEALTGDKRA